MINYSSEKFKKVTRITIVINLILAPLIGTACIGIFAYNKASFIFATDLAGVPVYLYAFISMSIPVYFATKTGNAFFNYVIEVNPKINLVAWLFIGLLSGAIIGGIFAAIMSGIIGFFRQNIIPMVMSGIISGLICGLLLSLIWWCPVRPSAR